MSSLYRLFIVSFVLLFICNSILAQDVKSTPSQEAKNNSSSAPTITAAFSADRIRFTALGEVDKLRLEVFSVASDLLFDSGFQPGSIRDWQFKDQQGQPLAEGSYLCVVTVKDLSGRLRFKQSHILMQAGQASLQLGDGDSSAAPDNDRSLTPVADSSGQALTVLAHDGTDGRVVSTSGALAFRLGNLFAGTDKEMMRLTPEGNFGIGLLYPQARLDVDGLIRTSQGILFPDGTIQVSAASKTLGAPSSQPSQKGGRLQPQAAGVGTQNYLAKWTDGAGTLGDSILFESAGKVGIGTTNPASVLDAAGAINTSTQYNLAGLRMLSNAGFNNLFVGVNAGNANTGSSNSFFGANAGQSNTTGLSNAFFGTSAGLNNTTGSSNSFFGQFAGGKNTEGKDNSFFGNAAGGSNTTGLANAFFGAYVGAFNTTGQSNSFFGNAAGYHNTTASNNSFFGQHAGSSNSTGQSNSFFGKSAGDANTTGSSNSFFGEFTGANNTSGGSNAFFGQAAGSANTSGSVNAFFGSSAGIDNTSGDSNSFFGVAAGLFNQTGTGNTFIGHRTGFNSANPTGDNNTLLGRQATVNSGVSYSTAIGTNAQATASNTIVLGTSAESVIVPGKLEVDILGVAGNQQLCLNNAKRLAPCSSSLRYKTDLQPFTAGLAIINRLEPISFTWKAGGRRDVGFGAEAVEQVEPLFITYNADGQVEGVKYDRLTVALVNAIKEQQQQLTTQQRQLAELRPLQTENAKLKAQLADILARLEQLEKLQAGQK